MSLRTEILNFLRDADYRVGELGTQIRERKYSEEVKPLNSLRWELMAFMNSLYRGALKDDVLNYLGWPEKEILSEIHRLRNKAGLNDIPYMSFTNYRPIIQIASVTSGSGSVGFPSGNSGDILTYNSSGDVVSDSVNLIGGFPPSTTIAQAFS